MKKKGRAGSSLEGLELLVELCKAVLERLGREDIYVGFSVSGCYGRPDEVWEEM
jgi:hypothetical protein